ncbi:MAG: histidine phosphatase family protein [Proteobacteria bacterium]|jgi:probable phosphoglycerate mutase|nr:histidine phosphatase family protein [Pseudomonadota bacterium]
MHATRILAVRHGETAWNVGSRIQGHLDIPLNPVGTEQARRLGRALAEREPIDAVHSSDLRRALDTARAVVDRTGAPLALAPGLRERCFGDLQGRTFAEISAENPALAESWRRRVPDWTPPGEGAESLNRFQARVLAAVQALAAAHLGQHIALFTHGGVLDVLYRAATGLGLQDARTWQIGNTAVNRLIWSPDGGLALVGWADTTHLEDESRDEILT